MSLVLNNQALTFFFFFLFFFLNLLNTFRRSKALNFVPKIISTRLRPDFTSNLVRQLAIGTLKFYTELYHEISPELVNPSFNCEVKAGLKDSFFSCKQ